MSTSELQRSQLERWVLADWSPHDCHDAVCLFGQAPDNEQSVLQRAAELYHRGRASRVLFSTGGESVTGEPWRPNYLKQLIHLGVPEGAIVPVTIADKLAHTHTEALDFVNYAKQLGMKTVWATAQPLHQFRAMLNFISIVLKDMPELKAYSMPGAPLPWTQSVVHSQNIERGIRYDLVASEWDRIERYHAKGDLVSAKEMLDYLIKRDQ